MTVLSLVPSTRALANKIKVPMSAAVVATGATEMTLALRENGSKVNGTLVAIVGRVGEVGDTFAARNGKNGAPYGVHTVLGTAQFKLAEDGVQLVDADSLLDFELDMKVPVFAVKVEAETAPEATQPASTEA